MFQVRRTGVDAIAFAEENQEISATSYLTIPVLQRSSCHRTSAFCM